MENDSNPIANLSVQLLELFGTLPGILIMGTDANGFIVYANQLAKSILPKSSNISKRQIIDGLISLSHGWKGVVENEYRFSQKLTLSAKETVILDIFCLQANHYKGIHYVFVIDLNEQPASDNEPFKPSMEHEPSVEILNQIIGLANHLMKKEGNAHAQSFARYVSEQAWKVKEAVQGSLLSKVRNLPEGYDLIDFQKIFDKALNLKQLNIDVKNIKIKTEAEPVIFFSHPQRLQNLLSELTSHFYQYAKRHPLTLSLRVEESKSGIVIRVKGNPVDLSKKGFLNEQVLRSLYVLNGHSEITGEQGNSVVVELTIPHLLV